MLKDVFTPLFDPSRIVFVKDGHEYYVDVDGKTIKAESLSRVLKKVGCSPEYGADIPSFVLEKAARRGTMVHEAVQNVLNDQPWSVDDSHKEYVEASIKLVRDYNLVPRMVEVPLYNPIFDYCCTPDFVGEAKGKPAIVDWKTTSVVHWQTGFQVAGQALCFRHYEEFDLYIGDLKNGVMKKIDAKKFLGVTKNALQHYNDVLDLEEDL